MTTEKNAHDGHRKRLRDRYMVTGGNGFSDHEILELLLFYSIKRQNTNEIAHALIERFGSIGNMLELSIDELKQVKGVGDESAVLLKIVLSLVKHYVKEDHVEKKILNRACDVAEYGNLLTLGAVNEQMYAIMLDDKMAVIDTVLVGDGSINMIRPIERIIFEQCLLKRASNLILIHNHPNAELTPSRDDIDFSLQLDRDLEIINVRLVDHFIVNGTEDYSVIMKYIRENAGYIDFDKLIVYEH